jgi:DNA-binding response OmpR family regulator
MNVVRTLKEYSKQSTILIVDDNSKLRVQLKEFLERFFVEVDSAEDGKKGLEIYKTNKADIIITDIQMPEINGMEMLKEIKSINVDTPVIVMSAYDEKEYLLDSIKYGVVEYLTKPVKINILSEVLVETLKKVKREKEKNLFNRYTHGLFSNQNSLIILCQEQTPLQANPAFLNFFNVESLEEFQNQHRGLGELFLKQEEFLDNSDKKWFSKVSKKSGAYYHVKLADESQKQHHFLLKYLSVSEDNDGYGLISLDDITELNLIALFNMDESNGESQFYGDENSIQKAIDLLMKKSVDIKVYNFYKGLSITNPAKIISFEDGIITLEENEKQLVANRYEEGLIIGSDVLPNFIWCDEILSIDYEKKYVKATNLKFMRSNPTKRKSIRLMPAPDYRVSFYFKLKEFLGRVSIVDISVDGVKLKTNSLLVGMREGETLEVAMTLARNSDNVSFEITSKILRIEKHDGCFHIAVEFEADYPLKHELIAYVSKRQMQLIREFKTLE